MTLENNNNTKDNKNKNKTINYNNTSSYFLHVRPLPTIQRRVHIFPVPSAPATGGCERSTPAAYPLCGYACRAGLGLASLKEIKE